MKFGQQEKPSILKSAPEVLWKAATLLNFKDPTANSLLDFHPEEIARQVSIPILIT